MGVERRKISWLRCASHHLGLHSAIVLVVVESYLGRQFLGNEVQVYADMLEVLLLAPHVRWLLRRFLLLVKVPAARRPLHVPGSRNDFAAVGSRQCACRGACDASPRDFQ